MVSTVMIIGGGKVGGHLAHLLSETGHPVHVVESDGAKAADLRGRFENRATIHDGSGSDAAVLEQAGIRTCHVVAAVTGADETNLVAASLARFEFGVPRVIARVIDPRNAWMYGPDMGVDVALDQADLLAHLVAEEMSLGEVTTLLKLRRGQFSLIEEKVHPESLASGRTIAELGLPQGCVVVAVIHKGELMVGHGDLRLQPADEVLAVVHADHLVEIGSLLGPSARGGTAPIPA